MLIVLIAKIVGGVFIYYWTNVPSMGTFWSDPNRVFNWEQNKVFLQNFGSAGRWPYLFVGWDSAWYLSIMTKGYAFSPQSYTFSPGLPFTGWLFSFVFGNPLVSVVLSAFVFGVLAVPLYQLVAENYVSRKAALWSALLFAFSPYLFLFTTVVYSEGLFLFFALGTWYLFMKGKVAYASVFASAAALTRIVGLLLVLPLFLASWKRKGVHWRRNVALSFAPIGTFLLWLTYCQFTASDFLAVIHTTEWSSLYTFRTLLLEALPQRGLSAIFAAPYQNWPALPYWLSPAAALIAVIVSPFLIYWVAKKDKALAVYSLATFAGVLAFGAIVSIPRFVSVLFPLWLPLTAKLTLNKKSIVIVAAVSAVFFLVGLDMWMSFLNGQFVA